MKKPTKPKPSTSARAKKNAATTTAAKKAAKAGKGKKAKPLSPWEQFALFVLAQMASGPLGEAGSAIRDHVLPELGKILFGFRTRAGKLGQFSPARRRKAARVPYALDIVQGELKKPRARAVLRTSPESFELIAPRLARIITRADVGALEEEIRRVLQTWVLEARTPRAQATVVPRRL